MKANRKRRNEAIGPLNKLIVSSDQTVGNDYSDEENIGSETIQHETSLTEVAPSPLPANDADFIAYNPNLWDTFEARYRLEAEAHYSTKVDHSEKRFYHL